MRATVTDGLSQADLESGDPRNYVNNNNQTPFTIAENSGHAGRMSILHPPSFETEIRRYNPTGNWVNGPILIKRVAAQVT